MITVDENNEDAAALLEERYTLAAGRIAQIAAAGAQEDVPAPFAEYFQTVAGFIAMMDEIRSDLRSGACEAYTLEMWQEVNQKMYADILPAQYEESYANPQTAVRKLGASGALLASLYTQIRGLTGYIFEDLQEAALIHLELFLEVYGAFAEKEPGEVPKEKEIRQILYWFAHDNCDILADERIRQNVDPSRDFAARIIMESDLADPRYLYRYGEYITEDELKTAAFLGSLSEEEIEKIASTYAEGYRMGFVNAGKDLSKKLTVNIRYHLGFERVVRRAVELFREMGLQPVIYRYALSSVNRRGAMRLGYTGANANPQYDYDHREDQAIFLDRRFMTRRLDVMRTAFERYKTLANGHAGPAVIETFGEAPFSPVSKSEALRLTEKQQALQAEMTTEISRLTNTYIIGEERSFTIIAFPLPQIGPDFEKIFADTVRINTLDQQIYRRIQQVLIDALDEGVSVHILGMGQNRTDLTVALHELQDPAKQTNFENCLADVNIPVGEVFTSPRLTGTNGTLHVTGVYLQELYYENLELVFKDGFIESYSCTNFPDEADGRAYIRANVLYHHDTLPMGEFAIGTNTDAYVMAEKYRIGGLLPILIAEKTGPHFAVGDTCYSWEEDNPVCNPDGKECIARDNEISVMRREDPSKAYFGCHTDITIPYDELGLIEVIRRDGSRIEIIRSGRFVLPGTEKLNEAFDR